MASELSEMLASCGFSFTLDSLMTLRTQTVTHENLDSHLLLKKSKAMTILVHVRGGRSQLPSPASVVFLTLHWFNF